MITYYLRHITIKSCRERLALSSSKLNTIVKSIEVDHITILKPTASHARFLRSRTVRSVTILIDNHSPLNAGLRSVLAALLHTKGLRQLELKINLELPDNWIHQFVKTHGKTLEKLHINIWGKDSTAAAAAAAGEMTITIPPTPNGWLQRGPLLSSLTTLSIHCHSVDQDTEVDLSHFPNIHTLSLLGRAVLVGSPSPSLRHIDLALHTSIAPDFNNGQPFCHLSSLHSSNRDLGDIIIKHFPCVTKLQISSVNDLSEALLLQAIPLHVEELNLTWCTQLPPVPTIFNKLPRLVKITPPDHWMKKKSPFYIEFKAWQADVDKQQGSSTNCGGGDVPTLAMLIASSLTPAPPDVEGGQNDKGATTTATGGGGRRISRQRFPSPHLPTPEQCNERERRNHNP